MIEMNVYVLSQCSLLIFFQKDIVYLFNEKIQKYVFGYANSVNRIGTISMVYESQL